MLLEIPPSTTFQILGFISGNALIEDKIVLFI
jgi:hypothetical protein